MSRCPQNVWNHENGCACPPATHRAESPARGTSRFGSLRDMPAPAAPRPLMDLSPSLVTMFPKVEPLPEIPVAERLYESVDTLPKKVQDKVFAAAFEWVAQRHFDRNGMSSHQYDPFVDEVAERSERDLDENYEDWMAQYDLDGRKPVTATTEETS